MCVVALPDLKKIVYANLRAVFWQLNEHSIFVYLNRNSLLLACKALRVLKTFLLTTVAENS